MFKIKNSFHICDKKDFLGDKFTGDELEENSENNDWNMK